MADVPVGLTVLAPVGVGDAPWLLEGVNVMLFVAAGVPAGEDDAAGLLVTVRAADRVAVVGGVPVTDTLDELDGELDAELLPLEEPLALPDEDDVTVAAGVREGVRVRVPVLELVAAGELVTAGVVDSAGVPDTDEVAVDAGVVVTSGVPDTDEVRLDAGVVVSAGVVVTAAVVDEDGVVDEVGAGDVVTAEVVEADDVADGVAVAVTVNAGDDVSVDDPDEVDDAVVDDEAVLDGVHDAVGEPDGTTGGNCAAYSADGRDARSTPLSCHVNRHSSFTVSPAAGEIADNEPAASAQHAPTQVDASGLRDSTMPAAAESTEEMTHPDTPFTVVYCPNRVAELRVAAPVDGASTPTTPADEMVKYVPVGPAGELVSRRENMF